MVLTLKHNHERGAVCEPCNEAMGMYQCDHCKRWSFKENWGPGWVRCPFCKLLASSVGDRVRMDGQ